MAKIEYAFDFTCLDKLTSNEIKSLLKSNRISWRIRKLIHISLAGKVIEEHIPIIVCAIIGKTVMEIINHTTTRNATSPNRNKTKC